MESDRELHIISFNVPYPPNYGGVMDVFFKIRALHEQGIKIHLHCFYYGRAESEELEKLCHKIYYYPRKLIMNPFHSNIPYIVKSRVSNTLLNNLLSDNHPVFFEGIHTAYYLDNPELFNRMRIVRMHNIEYLYYKHLAKIEKNPFKSNYYNMESKRLRKFEKKLSSADYIASISRSDHKFFNLKYSNSFYLPVFHPNEKITSLEGKGDYILYHGNLGVGENNEAALFLINEVFSKCELPFIIAGMNPSKELKKTLAPYKNIRLLSDISLSEIYSLIRNAHINVLPTFQDTGIKLKLLNALFMGRFCIVNNKMIHATALENACIVANNAENILDCIRQYFEKPFKSDNLESRKSILENEFNNTANAIKLIQKIYN
jgi:hypothetical protein